MYILINKRTNQQIGRYPTESEASNAWQKAESDHPQHNGRQYTIYFSPEPEQDDDDFIPYCPNCDHKLDPNWDDAETCPYCHEEYGW